MKSLSLAIFTVYLLAVAGYMVSVKAGEIVVDEHISGGFYVRCEVYDNSLYIDRCWLRSGWQGGGMSKTAFSLTIQRDIAERGRRRAFFSIPDYKFEEGEIGKAIMTFRGGNCNVKWTLTGMGDSVGSLRIDWATEERDNWRQFKRCFKGANGFRLRVKKEAERPRYWGHNWSLSGSSNAMTEFARISNQQLGRQYREDPKPDKKIPNYGAPEGLADGDEPDINDIFDDLLEKDPPASTTSDQDWKF